MIYATESICGRRTINEDRCEIADKENGMMLAVLSDGMGGHAHGEIASMLTVNTLCERFMEGPVFLPEEYIKDAISAANLNVFRKASSSDSFQGMGATVVCAVIDGNRVYAANIGDSRLYHWTASGLSCITRDHSYVRELVDMGQITPEEAAVHPMRNYITRSVGTGLHVEPDIFRLRLMPGQMLLLCSDGLSGTLNDELLSEIISEHYYRKDFDIHALASQLVQTAYNSGSADNISVCLVYSPEEDK